MIIIMTFSSSYIFFQDIMLPYWYLRTKVIEATDKKWEKNTVKVGKNAKNRLKIKEKAESNIIFKNEEISWKEELAHPS